MTKIRFIVMKRVHYILFYEGVSYLTTDELGYEHSLFSPQNICNFYSYLY